MSDPDQKQGPGLRDRLLALPQYIYPAHALSRGMHALTRCRTPWLKNALIRGFARWFDIDWSEAARQRAEDYEHFNAFFTRPLRQGARSIATGEAVLASPVDGRVSQGGGVHNGRIFQAKGQDYSLLELLGGDAELNETFAEGEFLNLYLSPRDYHRIHMPVTGTLREMHYVPGRLFSVSPATVRAIPRLFARNERVISIFDTAAGPMAVIKVGAIFVSGTETVWAGEIGPRGSQPWRVRYQAEDAITLRKGEELGRFNMGSTVILLLARDRVTWRPELLEPDRPVRMGEAIGELRDGNAPA